MSGVLRPRGPHSSQIYWRRRLVLLTLGLLVVLMLWWVAAGRSDAGSPAAGQTPRATQHHQHPRSNPPTAPVSPGPTAPTNAGRTTAPAPSLAPPSDRCGAADVALRVRAADAVEGHGTEFRLVFRGVTRAACTLDVAPGTVEIRVVSASSVVWATADCPDLFPAKRLVVRAGVRTTYDYDWNGHSSVLGCHGTGSAAKPGQYWVEAAMVGGNPVRVPFTITAAPGA